MAHKERRTEPIYYPAALEKEEKYSTTKSTRSVGERETAMLGI
jgi:hypothetical protein